MGLLQCAGNCKKWSNMYYFVNTLIESLRIFRKGFFLEPSYTVVCKYYNNNGSRIPGIFRTKYIEAIWGEDA